MLRVAFTSQFGRGRLQDLVALLSGRNYETREYEEAIAEASFDRLRQGVMAFINETHFNRLVMILRSAGFVTRKLIGSSNAVNFAYVLYLRGRAENLHPDDIERTVQRWYVMSILTQRYGGNPETAFDRDIRQIDSMGLRHYANSVIENELHATYWTGMLPQSMATSSATSPYFAAFQAAQAYLGDRGFLSKAITVRDLLVNKGDRHHVFPRKYLQKQGLNPGRYNQIANFVIAQSEINIAIGDTPPVTYFGELTDQVHGGPKRYGGITDEAELRRNLGENCIPSHMLKDAVPSYDDFLDERRRLMALRIKKWFEKLS